MNPLVVLLGLALIVANLLLSPQGQLLMQALGVGGPATAGAGLPGFTFPARPPGAPPGGSAPPAIGPGAPALPAPGAPALPEPGVPALPPPGIPA